MIEILEVFPFVKEIRAILLVGTDVDYISIAIEIWYVFRIEIVLCKKKPVLVNQIAACSVCELLMMAVVRVLQCDFDIDNYEKMEIFADLSMRKLILKR